MVLLASGGEKFGIGEMVCAMHVARRIWERTLWPETVKIAEQMAESIFSEWDQSNKKGKRKNARTNPIV